MGKNGVENSKKVLDIDGSWVYKVLSRKRWRRRMILKEVKCLMEKETKQKYDKVEQVVNG